MKKMLLVLPLVALTVWSGPAVLAQDFLLGLTAAEAGDYATTLEELEPLAEQGHVKAQYFLGLMHTFGKGVPQSHVAAHMWYNIASANGDSEAGEYRDKLADEMTKADISKAQEMARECMNSDYENCGW